MRRAGIFAVAVLLLLCAAPMRAQGGAVQTPGSGGTSGGCTNSPENPTALLALVGTAGGFVAYARARRRARREK